MKNIFEFQEYVDNTSDEHEIKGYGPKVASFKIGTDFYLTPSTKGETRYYKIYAIEDGKVKAYDYEYVINGKDIKKDKVSSFTIPAFAYDVNQNKISKYERGDL